MNSVEENAGAFYSRVGDIIAAYVLSFVCCVFKM